MKIFITYYFQSDNCLQEQQLALNWPRDMKSATRLKDPPTHKHVFPTCPHPRSCPHIKMNKCQEHVLLNSHLSQARERGRLFSRRIQVVCILGRRPWFSLSWLQVGRPGAASVGCILWPTAREIDYSNVTGTRTCSLHSRRQIKVDF